MVAYMRTVLAAEKTVLIISTSRSHCLWRHCSICCHKSLFAWAVQDHGRAPRSTCRANADLIVAKLVPCCRRWCCTSMAPGPRSHADTKKARCRRSPVFPLKAQTSPGCRRRCTRPAERMDGRSKPALGRPDHEHPHGDEAERFRYASNADCRSSC